MDYPAGDNTDELIDMFCVACDLSLPTNDLGLCDTCFAKLERDLIRSRDWDYSVTAFWIATDQLEATEELYTDLIQKIEQIHRGLICNVKLKWTGLNLTIRGIT